MSGRKNDPECWAYLDAYFRESPDSMRWTSQDIIDNLRDTVSLTKNQVNEYMLRHNYSLTRDDDRLVWMKTALPLPNR